MRFKIFAITAATLLLSQPAAAKTAKHNIVVQSYRDIQNSNMYEPGFNQGGYEARVKQKQKESVIAVAEPDEKPAEDYNEKIAGELFKKDMVAGYRRTAGTQNRSPGKCRAAAADFAAGRRKFADQMVLRRQ